MVSLSGCYKEGTGGEAEIRVMAMRGDSLELTNATFYLKYNADKFPGTDLSLYDARLSTSGHRLGTFTGLKQGDYYVYCIANFNGVEMRGSRHVRIWLKRQSGLTNIMVKP
jgi:hypothetical protein